MRRAFIPPAPSGQSCGCSDDRFARLCHSSIACNAEGSGKPVSVEPGQAPRPAGGCGRLSFPRYRPTDAMCHGLMHRSKTSGRAFPAVSFVYFSVECPFDKFHGINCRLQLGAKLLNGFFHRCRQVSPPVNNLTHRFFDGSQHVLYCNVNRKCLPFRCGSRGPFARLGRLSNLWFAALFNRTCRNPVRATAAEVQSAGIISFRPAFLPT